MNQPLNSPDTPVVSEVLAPHEIERVIVLRLQSHPTLHFSRLNVHQCARDSVCLEGILECNEDDIDLCELVRGIHGINVVLNHVLTVNPSSVPKKG